MLMSDTVARGQLYYLNIISRDLCRRTKDLLMSGTVARGGARAALSPLRMDSCIADPQQELLIVFKERNLR